MCEFSYTISDPDGIHARPAGLLVKEASKYASSVTISIDGKSCDAKKIFALMSLAVKQGQTITVTISGEDEIKACEDLKNFLKSNL